MAPMTSWSLFWDMKWFFLGMTLFAGMLIWLFFFHTPSKTSIMYVPEKSSNVRGLNDLLIYRDESNHVTCYRVDGYDGISCVSDAKAAGISQ